MDPVLHRARVVVYNGIIGANHFVSRLCLINKLFATEVRRRDMCPLILLIYIYFKNISEKVKITRETAAVEYYDPFS